MKEIYGARKVTMFRIAPGAALWNVAKELAAYSEDTQEECIAIFNGRALHAKPGTTDRDLLQQFDSGMKQLFNAKHRDDR